MYCFTIEIATYHYPLTSKIGSVNHMKSLGSFPFNPPFKSPAQFTAMHEDVW